MGNHQRKSHTSGIPTHLLKFRARSDFAPQLPALIPLHGLFANDLLAGSSSTHLPSPPKNYPIPRLILIPFSAVVKQISGATKVFNAQPIRQPNIENEKNRNKRALFIKKIHPRSATKDTIERAPWFCARVVEKKERTQSRKENSRMFFGTDLRPSLFAWALSTLFAESRSCCG